MGFQLPFPTFNLNSLGLFGVGYSLVLQIGAIPLVVRGFSPTHLEKYVLSSNWKSIFPKFRGENI